MTLAFQKAMQCYGDFIQEKAVVRPKPRYEIFSIYALISHLSSTLGIAL
jgi:hypothetical protein